MRSVRGSVRGWSLAHRKRRKFNKLMPCYQRRNELLPVLGYANYKEYLASSDWSKIRADAIGRQPNCILCLRPASQVHHTSYDDATLLGLAWWNLVALCNGCHESIEFDGKEKRTLERANDVLFMSAKSTTEGRKWAAMVHSHRWQWAKKVRADKKEMHAKLNKRRHNVQKIRVKAFSKHCEQGAFI